MPMHRSSSSGVKRESAGTGVFLPRRYGTPPVEPPRKNPCKLSIYISVCTGAAATATVATAAYWCTAAATGGAAVALIEHNNDGKSENHHYQRALGLTSFKSSKEEASVEEGAGVVNKNF
ncbi:hypothetical protein ACFE04_004189 [Oxalis oulophora]